MSVISRRSKRKTKRALARHGVKGAAAAAPVVLTAGAKAQHAKRQAERHASHLADEVRNRGSALGSQAAGQWKDRAAPALSKAASDASSSAAAARDWAAPRLAEAGEMSRAQLTQAYGRGVEAAAPKVEHAAGVLAPKVDHARDRIVDDFLPRLVDSVSAAAATASDKLSDATDAAASASRSALSTAEGNAKDATRTGTKAKRQGKGKAVALRGKVEVQQRRSGVKTFFLVTTVVGAAAAAGYAVWRARTPSDPWVPATGGDQTRLSHPGQGSGVGSGGLASSSSDVNTPAPDGRTAPPDESGKTESTGGTTPATGTTATTGTGTSTGSAVPPRSNPPKAPGSTSREESRAADPETARARDIKASGEASEVTETVVRPAPRDKDADPAYGKPATSSTQGDSGRPAGGAGNKPGDAKPAGATSPAQEGTGTSPEDRKSGTANS